MADASPRAPPRTAMNSAGVDHLVVFAADLSRGAEWCEAQLGVTPHTGGEHPLMGTHNLLLNVSSALHPRAYLEIIAIHAGAPKAIPASASRWFDMDSDALQTHVMAYGPHLIAWAAAVPDLTTVRAAWAGQGLDCGPAISASRPTPAGLLTWRISVRGDGQRLMQGCLPTLIEWGSVHPCDRLPASGVQLDSLTLVHPQASVVHAACAEIGLGHLPVHSAPTACLQARLITPRGNVALPFALAER